jgi:hypothetical protein
VLLVVPFLAAVLLSGCSAADPADPPARLTPGSTSSAPTGQPPVTTAPPTTDPDAATKTEILRVYAKFMKIRNRLLNNPIKPPDPDLKRFSTGGAERGVLNLAVYYRSKGLRIKGAPTSTPGAIMIDGKPPNLATFSDCLDSTKSFPVLAKTGESALAPGQSRRIQILVSAIHRRSAWKVSVWVPHRDRPC